MRRIVCSLTLVLACVASIAAGDVSTAKPCDTGILVLSGSSETGFSSDTGSSLCIVNATRNKADGRIINPGSDLVLIRYELPVRYNPSRITATLNGLGFRNKTVYLGRSVADLTGTGDGVPLYESGNVWLPNGSSSTGCLKVNVKYVRTVNGRRVTVLNRYTQYFTFDAGC